MNTASKENCKRLYELSGWVSKHYEPKYFEEKKTPPLYDSGYLLRKLPAYISIELQKRVDYDDEWSWNCVAQSSDGFYWVEDGFLEDVLCLLAIKLFENGILTKQSKGR